MVLSSEDFVSPPEVIAAATALFKGEIELDPASSFYANSVVQATKYFTWENNGLTQSWKAKNVYLYPPRDILLKHEQPKNPRLFQKTTGFKKSSQRVWLELAYQKWLRQEFNEGLIFITSSEVALITTQKIGFDFPVCILKERPKLRKDREGLDKIKSSKVFGFIFYLPPSDCYNEAVRNFYNVYSSLGRVYT